MHHSQAFPIGSTHRVVVGYLNFIDYWECVVWCWVWSVFLYGYKSRCLYECARDVCVCVCEFSRHYIHCHISIIRTITVSLAATRLEMTRIKMATLNEDMVLYLWTCECFLPSYRIVYCKYTFTLYSNVRTLCIIWLNDTINLLLITACQNALNDEYILSGSIDAGDLLNRKCLYLMAVQCATPDATQIGKNIKSIIQIIH